MVTFALDISHYQPASLDLAEARREGCELVIIKAGEGASITDPAFANNLAKGRAAGLLTAAYWYLRSSASAQAHADLVRNVVPHGVPVIPDVESGSGGVGFVQDVVNRVRAAGYLVPLTYLPRWYWQQLGSPSLAGLPPLWSSRYPDTAVGSLADEWADVPAGYWDGYGGLGVELLQFSSSARIAGYAPLDANAYRGTREQLAALLGQGAGPENDEETTMLVPAGTNEHVVLPCAGRPLFWYLYAAFGHSVTVHQCAYVMPTQYVSTDPVYAGGGWNDDHVFNTDRPGPIDIPRDGNGNQPVGVVLRYTADHAFTTYVG
ncbi:hypothetical protein FPZ12_013550 [Amycolatopsis acidicola]|uniref:Glycoside hydrolase n=1 Tax=Amycolatopsis acidicola TaxID=2596893 RepID=A0A5N0VAB1_9PSEU|nr:glycoside hydrolase family 25 protein [Amycolatopsis acidicola]KAA9161911.1 hypothetical protein FPZ12_013550 [Amycolatopsis acidicola]